MFERKINIFNNNLLVLANGSATIDFKVGKRLRMGNPISFFYSSIVVEGLSGMTKRVAGIWEFSRFKVNNLVGHNILQFAYGAIIVGDGYLHNLWCINAFMRGYELVSGLSVHFFKNKLYGLNISENFMQSTLHFLTYCKEFISFKFLSILVGSNHRRSVT